MPKIVNIALKTKAKAKATGPEAEAKAIKFGLEAPRGQGLASRTTSLKGTPSESRLSIGIPLVWDKTVSCRLCAG